MTVEKIENKILKVEKISKKQTNALKGIAIVLVVGCHIGNHFTRATTPLGGIGVFIFLLCSGYGLEASYQNEVALGKSGLEGYWRKRFIGVWLPYAVIECIMYLIKKPISLKLIILDLTLIKPYFALGWYLNYLLLWYITFWSIYVLFGKQSENFIIRAFCIMAVVYATYFNVVSSIRFEQSLAFVGGILINRYPRKFFVICKKKWCLILFFIATTMLALKQLSWIRISSQNVLNILNLFIKTCAGCGIILTVCLISNSIVGHKAEETFAQIGKASYELYLVHGNLLTIYEMNFGQFEATGIIVMFSIMGTVMMYYVNTMMKKSLGKILLINDSDK